MFEITAPLLFSPFFLWVQHSSPGTMMGSWSAPTFPPTSTHHNHAANPRMLHVHPTKHCGRGPKPSMQLDSLRRREAANFGEIDVSAVVESGVPKREQVVVGISRREVDSWEIMADVLMAWQGGMTWVEWFWGRLLDKMIACPRPGQISWSLSQRKDICHSLALCEVSCKKLFLYLSYTIWSWRWTLLF